MSGEIILMTGTNVQRGDIWQATWQLIKANPLTGIGFGAYQTAIPAYHDASGGAGNPFDSN